MKFTDEQVMRYVDGEAGLELKTKIMKALEKKAGKGLAPLSKICMSLMHTWLR